MTEIKKDKREDPSSLKVLICIFLMFFHFSLLHFGFPPENLHPFVTHIITSALRKACPPQVGYYRLFLLIQG